MGVLGDVDGVGGGVGEVDGEVTLNWKVRWSQGTVGGSGRKNNILTIRELI